MSVKPPRIAEWVMRASLPPADRPVVLGDISEAFDARVAETGVRRARRWYWRQTAQSLAPNLRRTIPGLPIWPFHRRDVRYAIRTLRRAPWYSGAAIAVIALSMAIATTAFAVVDGVLFKPLPYPRVAELYLVTGDWSRELRATVASGHLFVPGQHMAVSYRDVRDFMTAIPAGRFTIFSPGAFAPSLGDLRTWTPTVASIDDVFFDVVGMPPLLGGFMAADFTGTAGVIQPALISYDVWQSKLGGRVDAIGEILPTGNPPAVSYRVTGVLAPRFLFPTSGRQPDVLTPLFLTAEERSNRAARAWSVLALLPNDRPMSEYHLALDAVGKAGRNEIPDQTANGGLGYWDLWTPRPVSEEMTARQSTEFATGFYAALALVLLSCTNVAGLVASRAQDRVRELSLRRALGATARDLATLVVAESALLVAAGSAAGLMLSRWLLSSVTALMPSGIGLLKVPAMDARVIAFAVIATVAAVVIVAIWPVRRSLRETTPGALNHAPTVPAVRSRGRFVVISVQVAIGLALFVTGAVVLGSLLRIWRSDIGFRADRLIVVQARLYEKTPEARSITLSGWIDRVRLLPGVDAAGVTSATILRGGTPGGEFYGDTYPVSAGFFEAIQPHVIEGRLPSAAELTERQPVAVISRKFAARYFPDGSPTGKVLAAPSGKAYAIVGLVDDAQLGVWGGEGMGGGQFYRPMETKSTFTAVVRVSSSPDAVLARIIKEAPNAALRITTVSLADDLLADTIRPLRFQSWVFASFGVAALAIVGVGIFGVVAMTTARRTREIGVRMALGATGRAIGQGLLKEQVPGLVCGTMGGLLLSMLVVSIVRMYVASRSLYDLGIWSVAVAVVFAVGVAGVLIPARRAARIDPSTALRAE